MIVFDCLQSKLEGFGYKRYQAHCTCTLNCIKFTLYFFSKLVIKNIFQATTTPGSTIEAFPDDYFEEDFGSIETSQENESDEDAGVLKTNTKTMTFYHCLFGGYGPNGPMAGVGHVGAAFIRRRSPIIPALPRSFPLGSQGVQATIFKKTLFVCSPGAAVENAQFFRFVHNIKKILAGARKQ